MSITAEIQQVQDESREGWVPEKQPAPDYGEPWEHTSFRNCIRDRHQVLREILAQIPDAYDSRFFRAVQWATAARAKLQPFIKP